MQADHRNRAARMSPPAAASAAADTVSVPRLLTTAPSANAADTRAAMISPAAKPAQAQRLQFSTSEQVSVRGFGTERVKTAWGSGEHSIASAVESGLHRPTTDESMHANASGIEPPAVVPTNSPQRQSQHLRASAEPDDGGSQTAPTSAQVRKFSRVAWICMRGWCSRESFRALKVV